MITVWLELINSKFVYNIYLYSMLETEPSRSSYAFVKISLFSLQMARYRLPLSFPFLLPCISLATNSQEDDRRQVDFPYGRRAIPSFSCCHILSFISGRWCQRHRAHFLHKFKRAGGAGVTFRNTLCRCTVTCGYTFPDNDP